MQARDAVQQLLLNIYGQNNGRLAFERLIPLLEKYPLHKQAPKEFFSQRDTVLITYGNSLHKDNQVPLKALYEFASNYLRNVFSTIHFLPFFPYSSDDGFSVMDFFAIDPDLGSWDDVQAIGKGFKLMFDYVVNHFSSQSQWFDDYLAGNPGYENFAIEVDPSLDLSMVTRPRSLPLLSKYKKHDGRSVHLWTTFSADQIDFNFKSLDVLLKMVEVLLFYVGKGATILRLDAIAYLWKEIGTPCIHLSPTHDMVKLFRAILDMVAPNVMLLTETNVPHEENISYFGNGRNEAQMVYNFTLPPLLFYTFVKEDATVLSDWARGLGLKSSTTTFFNFTASHDGIGVRPLEGILSPQELDVLIRVVEANQGQVSSKRNPDGSDSPYELNMTYVDAILADKDSADAGKFLASQSIQYVLPGVPATYIHSLLGSRNWLEGVKQTGRARTINREKIPLDGLLRELNDPHHFRSKVFFPYLNMIASRINQEAFHPNADFEIFDLGPKIFAIKRWSRHQAVYAVTNISSENVAVSLSSEATGDNMQDLISGECLNPNSFSLRPYQCAWLTADDAHMPP